MKPTKYVLDTNCFIDAAHQPAQRAAFARFCKAVAPFLYLSAVVAAELRAGCPDARARRTLEEAVIAPYLQRGRVITPSARAWEALGVVLSTLSEREGLQLARTPRSFIFDILIGNSCREVGAVLISGNTADLARIAKLTPFEFVPPYPSLG